MGGDVFHGGLLWGTGQGLLCSRLS